MESLFLWHTVTDKGATVLGNNFDWTRLKRLLLNDNKVGAEGYAAIANNPTWSNLNEIKNEGARESGKSHFWTKLAGLHLSSNQISDAGVRFMAANKKWINLKHLDLSRNLIGYKESLVLWGNAYWKKL